MATLGNVSLGFSHKAYTSQIPIDESICGFLFDTGGYDDPLEDNVIAKELFGSGRTIAIKNIEEAKECGILSDGVMGGVPYYHIERYYKHVGVDKKLYICFSNVTDDESDSIENMLINSNSEIFQIGIWSSRPVLNILEDINKQLSIVSGTNDAPSGYPSGINVVVSAKCCDSRYTIDTLPDLTLLEYNNISVLLGDDSGQSKYTGVLGAAMAFLSKAYAEENIGNIGNFNLNVDDDYIGFNVNWNDESIDVLKMNSIVSGKLLSKGYIFPVAYEEREGAYFLSGDATLSSGYFDSIHTNRVSQKIKRVSKNALLDIISSPIKFNKNMSTISEANIEEMKSLISASLNQYMINRSGQSQISAFAIDIDSYQPNMINDQLDIEFSIALFNTNDVLNFIETQPIA